MGSLDGERVGRERDYFTKLVFVLHHKRQSLSPGTASINTPGNKSQTRRNSLLKVMLQWQNLELLPPHPTPECLKLFAEAQIRCQFFFKRKHYFSKIFQNWFRSIWRQWFILGYIIYALFLNLCWFFLACRNNIICTSMARAYITLEDRNISSICLFCLTDCIKFHFTLCFFCFCLL